MALGLLIRQARQEAGLSQRQLCGGEITRNMLSQIENGTARPSMETLRYLAHRLGKPISFFLEEGAVSTNQNLIMQIRNAYAQGAFEQALSLLEAYRAPDAVFDQEANLLRILATMDKAETAISQGRAPYARTLLREIEDIPCLYGNQLQRRKLLLLAQAQPKDSVQLAQKLPVDDRELFLRARAALDAGQPQRSAQLLDAAEDQQTHEWCFLRGEIHFALREYAQAIACFSKVEDHALDRLEQCYEQLGNYKMAYHYACLRRLADEEKGSI